jgi:hypothetical protein
MRCDLNVLCTCSEYCRFVLHENESNEYRHAREKTLYVHTHTHYTHTDHAHKSQIHPWQKPEITMWISYATNVDPLDFQDLSEAITEPMIVGLRPRFCFDTFFFSCLTVFQLLTTSDLGDVMYPALRGTNMFAALYFVGLVVIGNFMLFNLFVAIIITGFSETKAMMQKEERENQRMIEADKLRKAQSLSRAQSLSQSPSVMSVGPTVGFFVFESLLFLLFCLLGHVFMPMPAYVAWYACVCTCVVHV